jgi:P-type Cu+ transporter
MKKKLIFKITDMHCTSCAINIDGELEDTDGVFEAKTNYAKQQTEVTFDPDKISYERIIEIIRKIGYTAAIMSSVPTA